VATYGWSPYGRDFYGPPQATFVDFAVDPIVANPVDYDLMSLTWTSPSGAWTGLKVLKSYTGYSVDETDGTMLLYTKTPAQSLVDSDVRPGAWHYYTLFVQSDSVWYCAGGTSALMVADHGYGDRLFERLPEYHQIVGKDSNDTPVENEALKKFLNVLGFGLDTSKTQIDALQGLNDPTTMHINDLARMADQLGITYESSAPSRLFRQRVRNAAVLGRERGTLEQLQSLISMTTSLDVVLSMSPNEMVTDDAATFTHPTYPAWSEFVNYVVGERVNNNRFVYQCAVGSFGMAQSPTGMATNNTWWTNLATTPDATIVDNNRAVYGWEPTHYSGALNPSLTLALGVQSFEDSADLTSNALQVLNTTGSTADLGARSIARRRLYLTSLGTVAVAITTGVLTVSAAHGLVVGDWVQLGAVTNAAPLVAATTYYVKTVPTTATLTLSATIGGPLLVTTSAGTATSIAKGIGESPTDPGQVFSFGAPIPVPRTWNATDTYLLDTLVNFNGMVYRAKLEATATAPNGGLLDDSTWEIIGLDDRVNLALSLYAKGTGTSEVAAYPVIEFYDALGVLVTTMDTENESATGSDFDSFGNRYGPLVTRPLDLPTTTSWTVQSGTWTVADYGSGVAWPAASGLITVPGTADGNVSATFDMEASGTGKQFVAFRGASATSFLKATRTALYSSASGTDTLLGTYSTAFSDSDRITINFVGTSITVKRNGASVLSVTSSTNQTAVIHGLGVA
jgi:hypothetical protein